jgi:Xaa-Pro aminopeptidase
VGAVEIVPTDGIVEGLRVTKDAAELDVLREAGRRLSGVARALISGDTVQAGRSERDVAADIDLALKRAGFSRPAFETIVAGGPNAALPHARPGDRELAVGDLVVLDFGGVLDGYSVDLTRTLFLGEPDAEARRLYRAVAEAQDAALAAVGPGVTADVVDSAARDVLVRHGLGEAFGHGTGHGLGLDVHEEPRVGRRRAEGPEPAMLAPGMVITIEPGAYVPGFGGVRIEDDVIVTETGSERITDVPRDARLLDNER